MLNIIIDAIENREELAFVYSGLLRIVQPAAVGVSLKGNEVLRCYQLMGGHVTPDHEWDLCYVDKIVDLRNTGNIFYENPPGYKKGDKGLITIFAEL